MIRLLLFFAVITLLSLMASWLLKSDGVLVIDWLGYHIESSLAFASGVLISSLLLFALLLRFIFWLKDTPHRLVNSYHERKKKQAMQALMDGFSAIALEDATRAKKLASKADASLPITLLLKAQAAYVEEDMAASRKYLTEMLSCNETELIGIKGLLQQAQTEAKWPEALALAEKAYRLKPEAKWANLALLSLYKQMERWKEALATTEHAYQRHALTKEEFQHEKAVLSYMQAREAYNADREEEAEQYAHISHQLRPSFVPATCFYAKLLLQRGKKRAAVKIIEEGWGYTPHVDLVALFLQAYESERDAKKIKRLSALALQNPTHPEAHSAVAGFLINLEAFDKAREHLQAALSMGETVMLCKLMVKLELKEKSNLEQAEEWLERALVAPLGAAYLCNHCGSYSISWEAYCSTCGTFDSFRLSSPSSPKIISPSAKERDLLAYAVSGGSV